MGERPYRPGGVCCRQGARLAHDARRAETPRQGQDLGARRSSDGLPVPPQHLDPRGCAPSSPLRHARCSWLTGGEREQARRLSSRRSRACSARRTGGASCTRPSSGCCAPTSRRSPTSPCSTTLASPCVPSSGTPRQTSPLHPLLTLASATQLSRVVFEGAVTWASRSGKSHFWSLSRGGPTKGAPRDASVRTDEDHAQLERMRQLGMSVEDEYKLSAMREYVAKVAAARQGCVAPVAFRQPAAVR